jgi:hypothetical protein
MIIYLCNYSGNRPWRFNIGSNKALNRTLTWASFLQLPSIEPLSEIRTSGVLRIVLLSRILKVPVSEARLGYAILKTVSRDFLSPLEQISGQCLKLSQHHGCLHTLPNYLLLDGVQSELVIASLIKPQIISSQRCPPFTIFSLWDSHISRDVTTKIVSPSQLHVQFTLLMVRLLVESDKGERPY